MAKQGKDGIVWTDESWNPIRGCSLKSDGCKHCYAMGVAGRFSGPGMPYEGLTVKTTQGVKWNGQIKLVPAVLTQPIKWQRPRLIFVNSMSDLFHDSVPEAYIDKVFAVMALAKRHIFQVLTKRPERMREYCQKLQSRAFEVAGALMEDGSICPFKEDSQAFHGADAEIQHAIMRGPLPNVHLGVSVEDRATADERIRALCETPAAVRWISAEPLLGPIDIAPWLEKECPSCHCTSNHPHCPMCKLDRVPVIHWIVAGGESGPKARPMHPEWVRVLQEQCEAAGAAFLFKQWGEWAGGTGGRSGFIYLQNGSNSCGDKNTHEWGCGAVSQRVGKKAAGRMLDGMQHDGYPKAAA